ncbi:MAG: 3-phosphoshikimate 1-carboxyvinyltransferase [Deltaproteobacteria bacterium]|nr:3-phosphoshikimate 1-carboxyvinyltransferase [Deltaproteobacteria bacterium]
MDSIVIKSALIEGELVAPPSKSMTIRAIAASLLACGKSTIIDPSFSDDGLASISLVNRLGGSFKVEDRRVIVEGTNGLKSPIKDSLIDCLESGLCARMFIPICALKDEELIVDGRGTLKKRPIGNLDELREFNIHCTSDNGYLPVRVKGRVKGASTTLDGSLTSQIISGLLFCLPLTEKDSFLHIKEAKSKPYIRMTLEILKMAGVKIEAQDHLSAIYIQGGQSLQPLTYTVEGDWSSASFFLVGAAISGSIFVKNLVYQSEQADRRIIDALYQCGAKVEVTPEGVWVQKDRIKPFKFDVSDCPDLFPPLCVLAACAEGKSTIYGVERQLFKESNRLLSMCEGFKRLGINFELNGTIITIEGRSSIKGGTIDPHQDHRIAMAFAILGLRSDEGIEILNPRCTKKSYPEFFKELSRIRR